MYLGYVTVAAIANATGKVAEIAEIGGLKIKAQSELVSSEGCL